jgi:3-phenylpropionate/trans-cinnamate dioxygenase ferredoxin reductase subunit
VLGLAPRPRPVPSAWSDQHGLRLHFLGRPRPDDRLVIEGDPAARDFTAVTHREGRPTGALVAGKSRELPRLRRLLAAPEPPQEIRAV